MALAQTLTLGWRPCYLSIAALGKKSVHQVWLLCLLTATYGFVSLPVSISRVSRLDRRISPVERAALEVG